MNILHSIAWMITILGTFNLTRIALFMTGADWHDVKHAKVKRQNQAAKKWQPWISVIVPAHNEEQVIVRNIASLFANDYPHKEVIVINDGSSDRTVAVARAYKRKYKLKHLHIYSQQNAGKAAAINRGLNLARGSLVMVLDADSTLHPQALREVSGYFRDPRTIMVAANVKIIDDGSIMSLVQKFEYLLSYRMKRALTAFNSEYIIGGVGSTFRKNIAKHAGGYDTDTITEDIDFTLKLIRDDNTTRRVAYAPSVLAYTESVMTFRQLIKQRFRWKYGRSQSLLKNKHMFWSLNPKHDPRLTWIQLPMTLFNELTFLLEPIMISFIFYVVARFHDFSTLLSAYTILTSYIILNIWAEETETLWSKFKLSLLAFVQYPLFFILLGAEYMASLKTLILLPRILKGASDHKWQHVSRSAKAVSMEHQTV